MRYQTDRQLAQVGHRKSGALIKALGIQPD
jgi:hypothetical protein